VRVAVPPGVRPLEDVRAGVGPVTRRDHFVAAPVRRSRLVRRLLVPDAATARELVLVISLGRGGRGVLHLLPLSGAGEVLPYHFEQHVGLHAAVERVAVDHVVEREEPVADGPRLRCQRDVRGTCPGP